MAFADDIVGLSTTLVLFLVFVEGCLNWAHVFLVESRGGPVLVRLSPWVGSFATVSFLVVD